MSKQPEINRVIGHVVECGLDFAYSSGTLSLARSVIWEVHAGDHIGLGECAMIGETSCPGFSIDTGMTDWEVLKRHLEPRVVCLLGGNPLRLEALLEPMPASYDRELLIVREGLSIALHDLVGCLSGLPVHALLGGRRRSDLPGMPVVHVGSVDTMTRRAHKWVAAGYRYLKIKFRGELEEDAAALRSIRAVVGDTVRLAVDANSGYRRIEDARRAIAALEPYGIDYFEDLLDADIGRIVELRCACDGARIMVDWQAWWPQIHQVVACGAADIVNHHPNNQGGLVTALNINAVAEGAGLETAVGSSGVFGVQDAAFQHLAGVIGITRPCEDIGLQPYATGPTAGEYAFDRDPCVVNGSYPINNGVIVLPDTPGLGITINPRRLAACKIGQIEYA